MAQEEGTVMGLRCEVNSKDQHLEKLRETLKKVGHVQCVFNLVMLYKTNTVATRT